MKVFKLETVQIINTSIIRCWDFFSNPENLKVITPDYMGFEIIGALEKKMYPGQIIQYYVKPVLGIPLRWVTEITQVREHEFFIDEQRIGPYRLWHHQHFFRQVNDGVEMRDIVHYALPLGILGTMVNALYVRKQLDQIFDYRNKKITELFHG